MLGDDLFNETALHPVALILMIFSIFFVFYVERRKAPVLLLIIVLFIPSNQRLVLGGIDFTIIRILVTAVWMRLVLKNEYIYIRLNKLDLILILWSICAIFIYFLQQKTVSAVINRFGASFDALGIYFFLRATINTTEDINYIIKMVARLSILLSCFFLFEKLSGINLFGYIGGVPIITNRWGGIPRAQGAFSHPILAGAVCASLMPYSIYLYKVNKKDKFLGAVSTISLIAILITVRSSTAFSGAIIAFLGLVLYRFKEQMKYFRIGALFMIISLDVVMKHRVWHLIARIDFTGGSTGYHRYLLIDSAIRYLNQWWLTGLASIESWNIWANDITNQYILEGIRGGLLTLTVFIFIFIYAYKYTGISLRKYIKKEDLLLCWYLGVSVAVHMINFIGVSYFGQAIAFWYLSLALIGSLFSNLQEGRLQNNLMKNLN